MKRIVVSIICLLIVFALTGCGISVLRKIEEPVKQGMVKEANVWEETVPSKKVSSEYEGYCSICFDGTDFIAVGTGGRIDRIALDKTVTLLPSATDTSLNGVISVNGIDVAVGEDGIILVAKKGDNFHVVNSGTDMALYGVTLFHNAFWAAGSSGVLLYSTDGEYWNLLQTKTKNDIRSISANERMCMAVTREGQILMSATGKDWNIMDYNEVYEGYDEPYWFHSIRACGDVFFVAGECQENSGVPVILSSDTGEVWMTHPINKINGEPLDNFLPFNVNVVGLDGDQIMAACNSGRLLTLTDCAVCHKLTVLTDRNINDLAFAERQVAAVGDGFWFDILGNEISRQYNIRPDQAWTDFQNGAYIVDVRTEEEYAESHIQGCIHIPLDQIGSALETIIPYKYVEIIFYCASGIRSQNALEEAIMMGYENVYNLGKIDDWPYEKASGIEGSFYVPVD